MADICPPGGTATRILQLVQEGRGLAAELRLPSNRVSSYLHQLDKSGRVQPTPFHGPGERPSVLRGLQAVPHE